MEFYAKLTDLLKSVRAIQKLESLKYVKDEEKDEKIKEFKDKLITFLKCRIFSKDCNNFRKYWIHYLKNLIDTSLKYCTEPESHKINELIKESNKDNYIKDSNINEINNRVDNREKENKDNNIKNINLKQEDKNIINLNHIELNNIKSFYPKNLNKEELNKEHELKININSNNKEEKKEKQNNIIINFNENNNNIKDNIDKFDFFENNNNRNKIRYNDDNLIQIENKNFGNPEIRFEKEKTEIKFNKNINIFQNNSKEKILENQKINIKDEKNIQSGKNEIKNINSNEQNNFFINKEKSPQKIKEEKEKNNNKNIFELKEEIKTEQVKNNNRNIKENNPIKTKQENEIIKIEQKCDELLNNSSKNNIIQIIFNSSNQNINMNCQEIFSSINKINEKKININEYQKLKEKLITLLCILYPFSKKLKSSINENIFNDPTSTDKKLYEFLSKSIIIKPLPSFKFFEFNDKLSNMIEQFCNDFKINSKYELYIAFTFLVILRNLRKYDKNSEYKKYFETILEKEFLLAFKLIFILKHQQYYEDITDDFFEIYNGLHFIKIFYDGIFERIEIIQKDENSDNYIFGKDKFLLTFKKDYNCEVELLFIDKDEQLYENIMNKIEHFYDIDRHDAGYKMMKYSNNKGSDTNFNFILDLVELEINKIEYIYNNFKQYQLNLIALEKDIFRIGQNALNLYNKKIEKFVINEEQKSVFESLLINIKQNIEKKYKNLFNLYPYGSITQFLGSKSSDLDLYLDFKTKDEREKNNILLKLSQTIRTLIGKPPEEVISTRLCLIKFKYGKIKGTDIDICIMGFCPYLHSILFRTYSLIDVRFSLLAISLKKFIEIIGIKYQEGKIENLNSFSWMILLITFLQDIIKPPILPKLLSDKNNSLTNYPIKYGNNYKKKENFQYGYKTFNSFIKSIKEENTQLPEFLFKKNFLFDIKNKTGFKIGENKLSCSELFLHFLEFVIYYFKYDSVYVNCSVENEGFESMINILNFENSKEKNIKDDRFYNYFKNKYCKKINYYDKSKTKDGFILIRDPFDPHYNPAQSLKKLSTFRDSLKSGYLSLIKSGKFEILEKKENNKEEIII